MATMRRMWNGSRYVEIPEEYAPGGVEPLLGEGESVVPLVGEEEAFEEFHRGMQNIDQSSTEDAFAPEPEPSLVTEPFEGATSLPGQLPAGGAEFADEQAPEPLPEPLPEPPLEPEVLSAPGEPAGFGASGQLEQPDLAGIAASAGRQLTPEEETALYSGKSTQELLRGAPDEKNDQRMARNQAAKVADAEEQVRDDSLEYAEKATGVIGGLSASAADAAKGQMATQDKAMLRVEAHNEDMTRNADQLEAEILAGAPHPGGGIVTAILAGLYEGVRGPGQPNLIVEGMNKAVDVAAKAHAKKVAGLEKLVAMRKGLKGEAIDMAIKESKVYLQTREAYENAALKQLEHYISQMKPGALKAEYERKVLDITNKVLEGQSKRRKIANEFHLGKERNAIMVAQVESRHKLGIAKAKGKGKRWSKGNKQAEKDGVPEALRINGVHMRGVEDKFYVAAPAGKQGATIARKANEQIAASQAVYSLLERMQYIGENMEGLGLIGPEAAALRQTYAAIMVEQWDQIVGNPTEKETKIAAAAAGVVGTFQRLMEAGEGEVGDIGPQIARAAMQGKMDLVRKTSSFIGQIVPGGKSFVDGKSVNNITWPPDELSPRDLKNSVVNMNVTGDTETNKKAVGKQLDRLRIGMARGLKLKSHRGISKDKLLDQMEKWAANKSGWDPFIVRPVLIQMGALRDPEGPAFRELQKGEAKVAFHRAEDEERLLDVSAMIQARLASDPQYTKAADDPDVAGYPEGAEEGLAGPRPPYMRRRSPGKPAKIPPAGAKAR